MYTYKNLTGTVLWVYLIEYFIFIAYTMDIQKQVTYFTSLSYEIRRAKVLDMLNDLKETHETFALLYTKINSLDNVSDSILVSIYQSILEIAEEISTGKKNKAQDKIKKMSEVLMMIKKQEEMEREREWNPDELLKKM